MTGLTSQLRLLSVIKALEFWLSLPIMFFSLDTNRIESLSVDVVVKTVVPIEPQPRHDDSGLPAELLSKAFSRSVCVENIVWGPWFSQK